MRLPSVQGRIYRVSLPTLAVTVPEQFIVDIISYLERQEMSAEIAIMRPG
jgi:hypothetical protein